MLLCDVWREKLLVCFSFGPLISICEEAIFSGLKFEMENYSLEDDNYSGLFITQSTQEDRDRYMELMIKLMKSAMVKVVWCKKIWNTNRSVRTYQIMI